MFEIELNELAYMKFDVGVCHINISRALRLSSVEGSLGVEHHISGAA
jgi:hypothetical protein